jgi:hypothetical protein
MRKIVLYISLAFISAFASAHAEAAKDPQYGLPAAAVSVNLGTGYLLDESNYLVTSRPVIQTNLWIPLSADLSFDAWYSHQLYQPTELFAKRGDELDLGGAWQHAYGAYAVRISQAIYLIPGRNNDIVDSRIGVERMVGAFTPFVALENQKFMTQLDVLLLHVGARASIPLMSTSIDTSSEISFLSGGTRVWTEEVSTHVKIGAVPFRLYAHASTGNHHTGTNAVAGIGFDF